MAYAVQDHRSQSESLKSPHSRSRKRRAPTPYREACIFDDVIVISDGDDEEECVAVERRGKRLRTNRPVRSGRTASNSGSLRNGNKYATDDRGDDGAVRLIYTFFTMFSVVIYPSSIDGGGGG